MSEIKTLMNCDTKDFLRTFNSLRNDFEKFFKKTKLNEIIYKATDIPNDMSKEEREKAAMKIYTERFRKVNEACFGENLDLTYDLLTKICFGNADFVNSMGGIEIISFITTVFTNPKLMPFFIYYFPSE